MKTWLISGGLHFIAGLVVGWVLLKRPQWVESAIDWAKAKLGF